MTEPGQGHEHENGQPDAREAGAPRLLKLAAAARVLNVNVKWIRAHRKQLPFVLALSPRVLRVDEAKMMLWLERRRA